MHGEVKEERRVADSREETEDKRRYGRGEGEREEES